MKQIPTYGQRDVHEAVASRKENETLQVMSNLQRSGLHKTPALAAAVTITAAWLRNASCSPEDVTRLLREVHDFAEKSITRELSASASDSSGCAGVAEEGRAPRGFERGSIATLTQQQIEESITDEYLICFEDGKKFKSLKNHLYTCYGLTPDQYRAKWGLPRDYPMVAPASRRKWSRNAYNNRPHLSRVVAGK